MASSLTIAKHGVPLDHLVSLVTRALITALSVGAYLVTDLCINTLIQVYMGTMYTV